MTTLVVGLCGLLILSLPAVSRAQQGAPAGEALYVERLGCWGCHGPAGEGGDGRPLRNTRLPLSRFIKELRLPAGTMPPFASFIVSDAELAMVYDWLDGVDSVATPPPITFTLEGFEEVTADTETEVAFTARPADTNGNSAGGNATRLRYRVTLMRRDNTPVANRTFAYQQSDHEDWPQFTTDEHGQAFLGPDDGFVLADVLEAAEQGTATRLRITLPAGRYVFVVEAIDGAESAHPVVVGIGTTIVNVE